MAERSVPALTRRFHVGDLLAAVMKTAGASPRGFVGLAALRCYMAGRPPVPDAALDDFLSEARADADDFAAAVLAAYPELGAFVGHAAPPPELLGLWLRRREREFGRYFPAPHLPAAHPLRRERPPRKSSESSSPSQPASRPAMAVPPAFDGTLSEACALCVGVLRVLPGAPGSPAGAAAHGPCRRRRFHIGDLLSVVMDRAAVAPRGLPGAVALLRYMADRPAADTDVLAAHYDDFRTAVLAAYPELGTHVNRHLGVDEPPTELLDVWLRRREREFGRYLVAPLLPASHPLRAVPPPTDAATPAPTLPEGDPSGAVG